MPLTCSSLFVVMHTALSLHKPKLACTPALCIVFMLCDSTAHQRLQLCVLATAIRKQYSQFYHYFCVMLAHHSFVVCSSKLILSMHAQTEFHLSYCYKPQYSPELTDVSEKRPTSSVSVLAGLFVNYECLGTRASIWRLLWAMFIQELAFLVTWQHQAH